MKDMKKILTLAIAAAACLTSCDDWLDLQPENSVSAKDYWKSEADVAAAMTGIYCEWLLGSSYIWQQAEMRADMVAPSMVTYADYVNVREGNITSWNDFVAWKGYYSVINQCNLLLERSEIALSNDPSYTVRQDSIYHAQARVVRDLMYFYLIRLWKDVPYITWAYYDDATPRLVGASKQMDILDALIADLEAVQKDAFLPYSYSAASTGKALNKGQVTMYMLKALLADMYRMKGSYATDPQTSQAAYRKCLELCNTIIESGQYALIPFKKSTAAESGVDLKDLETKADSSFYYMVDLLPTDWYDGLYVSGNSNESIMELQQDKSSYNNSGFYDIVVAPRYYTANVDLFSSTLFLPTEKELAMACRYRDIRSYMNIAIFGGTSCIWKFAGLSDTEGINTKADYKKNVLVYRLAEIYLMKAEVLTQLAIANNNDQEMLLEAYRAVFKVRDRAGAVETTDLQTGEGLAMQDLYWEELRKDLPITLKPGTISGSSMEKLILDEEAREMAFEGRRWFDVLRNAERNQEGKGACTGGNIGYLLSIAGSCTETSKVSYIMGQFKKPDFRYLPYPYQDVSINKSEGGPLKQKPFWGTE